MPRRIAIAALAAVPLLAAACGGGDTTAPAPPKTPSGQPATLGVENAKDLGRILDDAHGRTLYLFRKDPRGRSACTGACATAWPPLRANGKPIAGRSASASLLGTTPRHDGAPQITYNGHPLYTYTGDQKPGETNGQGLTAFGGGWFALSPSGNSVRGSGSNGGPGIY
jgi:predicted lipoprotein with Yx(FWY)xxD motif